MSVTLVETVGSASANSYASLAEAEVYFNNRLYTTNWTGTDDDKKRALIMATKELDRLEYEGTPASDTQSLKWPRDWAPIPDRYPAYYENDEIPQLIKDAEFEWALYILSGDVTAQTGLENYKRIKVDDIELEMNQPVQAGIMPVTVSRLLSGLTTGTAYGAAIVRA